MNDIPSISSNDNIYLHIEPKLYLTKHQLEVQSFPKGYNPCFEYKVGNDDDIISIIKQMSSKQQHKVNTSIGIFNSNIIMNEDPISMQLTLPI